MEGLGKIRRNTSFFWDIQRFDEIVEGKQYIGPEFEYDGKTYSHFMSKEKDCGVIRVGILKQSVDDGEPTLSHRMGIKDDKGKDFWTSDLISHKFDDYECNVCSHLLQKHSWYEKSRGYLSLYVTIYQGVYPPNEGLCMLSMDLKDMYLSEEDSDVTLDVKGRKFRVHTLILKFRSPVLFRLVLERESGDVPIAHCDPDAFHEFLSYLYSGRFEKLDVNNVTLLHYISHQYGVEGLAAICVQFMIHNMTVDNFCEFVAVGLQDCDSALKESASKFFARNFKLVFSTIKWKAFFLQNVTEAYELIKNALDIKELLPISQE